MWDEVVELLEEYYSERGRKYPWRYERDPFKVLVAEVLLQRTPAERCVEVYEKLLKKYPSCEAIASASREEVERAFARLGLFKRGTWLKDACTTTLKEFDGRVPVREEELKKLKGVGTYTARAVSLVIGGYGKLPVDVNIGRVLRRLGIPGNAWDDLTISREAFYGLIDLASSECKGEKPTCESCPLSAFCNFRDVKVKRSSRKSKRRERETSRRRRK